MDAYNAEVRSPYQAENLLPERRVLVAAQTAKAAGCAELTAQTLSEAAAQAAESQTVGVAPWNSLS
jgi:type IV pilus biogenesis protein CpaD/CtpE